MASRFHIDRSEQSLLVETHALPPLAALVLGGIGVGYLGLAAFVAARFGGRVMQQLSAPASEALGPLVGVAIGLGGVAVVPLVLLATALGAKARYRFAVEADQLTVALLLFTLDPAFIAKFAARSADGRRKLAVEAIFIDGTKADITQGLLTAFWSSTDFDELAGLLEEESGKRWGHYTRRYLGWAVNRAFERDAMQKRPVAETRSGVEDTSTTNHH